MSQRFMTCVVTLHMSGTIHVRLSHTLESNYEAR